LRRTEAGTAVSGVPRSRHCRLVCGRRALDRIDHYELQELLGEGGTGRVYRALDTRMRRTVAIKVLYPMATRDPKDAARFQREVRLAAALRHPNVLTVHDCSPPESKVCYLVTELITGGSLRQHVGEKMLAEEVALLLYPVALALEAAHARGIVHRDVKPDNILIDRRDKLVVIKLMDFGVAVAADEPRITTDNSLSGSIAYMAPEQLREGSITPASDIWSLGITFYELAHGEHPFDKRQMGPLVRQILAEEPRLSDKHLPPRFIEIVHRCLQRDPSCRFPDGAALALALREALAASGIARPEDELQVWAHDPAYRSRLSRRLAEQAGTPSVRSAILERAPAPSVEAKPPARARVPRWLVILGAGLFGAGLLLTLIAGLALCR
jgi:serine/threonine-protein kinase